MFNSGSCLTAHPPDQPALWLEGEVFTYQEFWNFVLLYKIGLCSLGIGVGDTIALFVKNQPTTLFIYLGLLQINAHVVWLNLRLSAQEINQQVQISGSKLLITDQPTFRIEQLPILYLSEIKANLPSMPAIDKKSLDLESDLFGKTICFTSGTSGIPKAVVLSIDNWQSSAIAVNKYLLENRQTKHQEWLVCLPLYHVGGLAIIWRSLLAGGSIHLLEKFDPQLVISTVHNSKVNLISLVPTMLKRLIAHPQFMDSLPNWQQMGGIFLGGARVDRHLLAQCLALKLPILVTYGMTELASQISILDLQKYPHKVDSVGQVLAHIDLKITDQEIRIKSPALMSGYLGYEQFKVTDYFATGDLGYLDAENFLYLHDRRSNLIISGGENIYPAELEQILAQHPQIKAVCVIAKPDPEWGQVPAVIYTATQELMLPELQGFCLDRGLARYKLPKYARMIPEMPTRANHKDDRQALIKALEAW